MQNIYCWTMNNIIFWNVIDLLEKKEEHEYFCGVCDMRLERDLEVDPDYNQTSIVEWENSEEERIMSQLF